MLNYKVFSATDSLAKNPVRTIVIDAGHGGKDPGAIGAEIKEKDVCLKVSLMLGRLINDYFQDVKVVYTREDDNFVKLYERAEIANKNKADLFISIHVNAAQNAAAYGTETLVMGVKYMETNNDIVKRENDVIFLEDDYEKNYDQDFVGFDPNSPMAQIIATLIQQENQGQSLSFANFVEDQFSIRQKRKSRGVKQRVLLVMYRTAMPGALIELGFLSNKEEHDLIKKDENLADYAGSIFRAFLQYKRTMEGQSKSAIAKEENEIFTNWQKYKKNLLKEDTPIFKPVNTNTPNQKNTKKEELADNIHELSQHKNLNELVFKVQISSSNQKIALSSHEFKGLKEVSFYQQGEIYKYLYGSCADMECALNKQKEAVVAGFKDCFVVAFYKGEKVSMKQVKEILENNKQK